MVSTVGYPNAQFTESAILSCASISPTSTQSISLQRDYRVAPGSAGFCIGGCCGSPCGGAPGMPGGCAIAGRGGGGAALTCGVPVLPGRGVGSTGLEN